ncbi:MAG: hypothetical protein HKL99_12930 [Burkholderiales bacterium]|nr:hypothetical protein [Burkholderiales bacterium]
MSSKSLYTPYATKPLHAQNAQLSTPAGVQHHLEKSMKNTRKSMLNTTASAATFYPAEQAAAIDKITQNCAAAGFVLQQPPGDADAMRLRNDIDCLAAFQRLSKAATGLTTALHGRALQHYLRGLQAAKNILALGIVALRNGDLERLEKLADAAQHALTTELEARAQREAAALPKRRHH